MSPRTLRAFVVGGLGTLDAAAAADALPAHPRQLVLGCLADVEDACERALLLAGDHDPRLAPVARSLRLVGAAPSHEDVVEDHVDEDVVDAALRALGRLEAGPALALVAGDAWTARAVRRALGQAADAVVRAREALRALERQPDAPPPAPPAPARPAWVPLSLQRLERRVPGFPRYGRRVASGFGRSLALLTDEDAPEVDTCAVVEAFGHNDRDALTTLAEALRKRAAAIDAALAADEAGEAER